MADVLTTPTIETGRLLLRPPRMADAGPIGHYCADPRLALMTAQIPHPYPPGAAEAYLANLMAGRLAEEVWVIDASPIEWSDMVGLIGFTPGDCSLGYWIGVPFWGTGFASEAVEALVAHLFGVRGVPRLTAKVMVENEASARVLEKAGFTVTGEDQIYSVARGTAVPCAVYAAERGLVGLK